MSESPKPSDKVKIIKSFKYRGVDVFVKRCYNVYEFMLSVDDKIFYQYYEMIRSKKQNENIELENQIIANLCSIAVATIEREKRSRWIKIKEYTKTKLKIYEHYFRKQSLKQEKPAA